MAAPTKEPNTGINFKSSPAPSKTTYPPKLATTPDATVFKIFLENVIPMSELILAYIAQILATLAAALAPGTGIKELPAAINA